MDKYRTLTRARAYLSTLHHVATGDRREDVKNEDRVWRLRCETHAAISRLMQAGTEAAAAECDRTINMIIKKSRRMSDGENQG